MPDTQTADGPLVTPEDERFHVTTTDDRSWTETAWFAAMVPERDMGIWTYPLIRPELGIMSCAIYVWGPGTEESWELPYCRTWWHLPIPEGRGPFDMSFPNGLTYTCVEPLRQYAIAFEDPELRLDLTFTALQPPQEVGVVPGGIGHFEHLGRVTGELWLRGEHIAVDCVDMRDRTWSPRRESRQRMHLTYSFGASTDVGFLMAARRDPDRGRMSQLSGYVLDAAGATRPLTSGTCHVDRDDRGRPAAIIVRGDDREWGQVEIVGEVRSRFTLPQNPWFGWVCLMRWTLPDGRVVYGEHQDAWSPALLRAARGEGWLREGGGHAAAG
jgi:hypothetical protein